MRGKSCKPYLSTYRADLTSRINSRDVSSSSVLAGYKKLPRSFSTPANATGHRLRTDRQTSTRGVDIVDRASLPRSKRPFQATADRPPVWIGQSGPTGSMAVCTPSRDSGSPLTTIEFTDAKSLYSKLLATHICSERASTRPHTCGARPQYGDTPSPLAMHRQLRQSRSCGNGRSLARLSACDPLRRKRLPPPIRIGVRQTCLVATPGERLFSQSRLPLADMDLHGATVFDKIDLAGVLLLNHRPSVPPTGFARTGPIAGILITLSTKGSAQNHHLRSATGHARLLHRFTLRSIAQTHNTHQRHHHFTAAKTHALPVQP